MRDAEAGGTIAELVRLFGRLGFTAFGGPAAHIAMMHDEVVSHRGWLDDRRFLDLIGITNLIPGPNSTEMAMHVGHARAGWRGLIAAGASFVLPAATIVLAFAWAYTEYGNTPNGEALLYGVKPVVMVVIGQALIKLGRSALKDRLTVGIALAAILGYLTGLNELLILALGGTLVAAVRTVGGENLKSVLPIGFVALARMQFPDATALGRLFAVFLKAGAFLYGSGYVLLAFLQRDLVDRFRLLTHDQLLDAIAIGQFTPGPVFTTATFVGYLLADIPGAVVATVGIFLPSFLFVGAITPIARRMRDRTWTGAVLDGVNASALGLMAGVTLQLSGDALVDPLTIVVAVLAAAVLWRTRLNSAWLMVGGGVIGLLAHTVPALVDRVM